MSDIADNIERQRQRQERELMEIVETFDVSVAEAREIANR
jgi:hypothetical protein